MLRAGTLKHLITIESFTTSRNEFREEIQTWTPLFVTKASIKPVKGSETFINQSVNATATHLVTFRYKAHITPSMRVLFNGRIFKIKTVVNVDELNQVHQLIVEEDSDDNG